MKERERDCRDVDKVNQNFCAEYLDQKTCNMVRNKMEILKSSREDKRRNGERRLGADDECNVIQVLCDSQNREHSGNVT